jgi:DNA repair exonuclease SbcCD ATPase subunit
MRVTTLRLENFRVHEDTVLHFGDNAYVVIRGRNFAGKTSIGQGLSMCLTPSTSGLDPQGRGYISKIRRGASKAVITADFKTKRHLVQRTVTLNTNASGRTQTTVCLSDPTWDTVRFDRELEKQRAALTVALNSDAFFRMDEKEQKNLLAGLALPSHYDFPPEIVADVDTILGSGVVHFTGEPFTAINQAYKKLFDERQIINRQVREFVVPEELPVPSNVDSYALQDQVAALRQQRRERLEARDQAVAEAMKEEQARAHAKARVEEAVASEERRTKSIREKLLKQGQLEWLRGVAARKAEAEQLEAERHRASLLREHCRLQLAGLESRSENKCPTCEQPLDYETAKALIFRVSEQLRGAETALAEIEKKRGALGDISGAIKLVEAHEKALKELDEFEEQAPERQRQIDEARQALPGPTLFDFGPHNESLAECDSEIERLSGLLRPVIAAEERQKEVAVKRGQLAALREKAELLDRLVKYFDKKGIKAKLLGDHIGGFERKLNEVLEAWGYSCALSIEPYSFDVTNARRDVIPLRELSGAERVMFSLAFQCAVARTANIGMVVIDEVAMFLPELRQVLNRRLYDMIREAYLDQVILLVADSSEAVPSLPGAVFYMIEDGAALPLKAKKETSHERRDQQPNVA